MQPALAVVECHGVGYGVNISLETYDAIQGKKEVKLWIAESIREDAYQLWGFATKVERQLFGLLTSVTGIGAATARMILSSMSPAEICRVISEGNDKVLKQVKGIGPKASQRIIVDLRDKITSLGVDAASAGANGKQLSINPEIQNEAVQALTMLGFSPSPSYKAVQSILKSEPDASVERVIKLALKML